MYLSMDAYLDFGGAPNAPIVHLAPANGFPPESYRPLAAALTARYHVLGYRPRPLHPHTDPQAITSWHPLADDLAHAAARLPGPLLGFGHSLGAILTIYAALRNPRLFRALVLCEPVLMPRRILPALWLMRRLGQQWRFPLARSAARRRDHFPDVAEARAHYGRRSFFADFTPEAMDGYLAGGLRTAQHGGLTLAWPRAWEARIFSLVPIDAWDALYKLRIPVLIIRGKGSDLLTEPTMHELRRRSSVDVIELDAGHMLPMERPVELAKHVMEWDR
jgi:pimeloyl-ACP methyl ester carboxylesterase